MNAVINPARVAIVATSLRLAGAEKQTYYIGRALRQNGAHTECFYLGPGGYYEGALQNADVPTRRIYTPNRPLTILAGLTRALRAFRPEIVFAAQFGDLRFAVPAGWACGASVLGGVRSDGIQDLEAHGWICSRLARISRGLVANSARARNNLVSRGFAPEKIAVLPNAIDLHEFDRRSRSHSHLALPTDRIIATAIGSLHPCKRFDRFIKALAVARRQAPSLAGVIAGADAGARSELEALARSLGLFEPDLIFLGEIREIPELLARASFLMLTSDYEGLPNVILEAMAARLPVITTPAGEAGNIVRHERTGYVVGFDDIEGAASCMEKLARSPVTRVRLGDEGRFRVEQDHSCSMLPKRLTSVLELLLDRRISHPIGEPNLSPACGAVNEAANC